MMDSFFRGDYALAPLDYRLVLLALLLAFSCGHVVAWTYMVTHTGLSYSRSFVNSLIIMPVIVALVLMVLSSNLVTAFGLLGVLSIVRFRNVLRDTFDSTYVLTVVVLGLACGTQKFASAAIGCLLIVLVTLYLWYSGFGARNRYGLIVNLNWSRGVADLSELDQLFARHTRRTHCASRRSASSGGTDLSFRLLLRDPNRADDLICELGALKGVSRLASISAEDESEF